MTPEPMRDQWLARRETGWSDSTGRWVTGVLVYLLVSGLAIWALPFSVFNQHAVLLHTLVGLGVLVPSVAYLVRHVRAYWDYPLTHLKLSGYLAGLATLVCSLSGLVLTWQAALGTGIAYLWRDVHVVATFATGFFLGAHLVTLWLRVAKGAEREELVPLRVSSRGWGHVTTGSALALLLATGALAAAVRPVQLVSEFPEGYDLTPYEGATPFSPSLANTADGGAIDHRALSGSESCGTTGCHEQIYAEWQTSAHRYASMDPGFQAIQGVMASQNGATSTRYCGGCHDPISLFSGTKNIGVEDLTGLHGYQEGISCLACHAIKETDVAGNANYVMTAPERYVWELREGKLAKALGDFLIRAYPRQHVDTLSHTMFKTPEFCAACHKQFIDEEVNEVGWVQLQNQFDNWRASRWYHEDNPERTIECRECHMPLLASRDPAAGDEADYNRTGADGRHRSHSFLGANQYVPTLLDLPGAAEHVADTHAWLRGERDVPEIAGKWSAGPAVPIELEVPAEVDAGASVPVLVHIVNNKVGHDFPTGPLDIIQAWVEVEVTDATGRTVFHTGRVDEEHFIETGSFLFKAEPVDRYGNLIDRHNLWEMVGVRFKRSLFAGSEEVASFSFDCDGQAAGELAPELSEQLAVDLPVELEGPLTVHAKLNYRKFDQYLLNFAFGEDAGLTAPITVLSEDRATIAIRPAAAPAAGL